MVNERVFLRATTVASLILLTAVACSHHSHADLSAPVRSMTGEERSAVVAAARQLFVAATARVPVCLMIRDPKPNYDVEPEAAVFRALGSRARRWRDCPPQYESMIYDANAKPRPTGYIDPYILNLWWPAPAQPGFVVDAELRQGTSFTRYRCTTLARGVTWEAACKVTGHGLS